MRSSQPSLRPSIRVQAWLGVAALALCPGLLWGDTKLDPASAANGRITYGRYCVSCHGKSGRGDGVHAKELQEPVPDLTTLATRNGGNYPYDRVVRIITNSDPLKGHGTPDMPAWGDVFTKTKGTGPEGPTTVESAVRNLAQYIWSLQKPSSK